MSNLNITIIDGDTWVIQSKIANHKMVSLGTRKGGDVVAKIKAMGWSEGLQREIGQGYEVIVINSLGEQFGDLESRQKMSGILENKNFADAKFYIDRMNELNSALLDKVSKEPEADCLQDCSNMMAYFMIIRWIIEKVYEDSSEGEQKYIDDWRNSTNIFSGLMSYVESIPEDDGDWSFVYIDGNLNKIDKIIRCDLYTDRQNQEILQAETVGNGKVVGKVGYPGKVSGRARVVLSSEERDAVEEGEIIVAPMTTIDFLPAMKKASAFVTDEGGVTCHAAIVAREMKKPCVIGTKNGSKIIKTGDMVELDASEGVVRVL